MMVNKLDANLDINGNTSFCDLQFDKLSLKEMSFSGKHFENCTFQGCDFSNTKFISCKFIDCTFKSCNLSSLDIKNTSFSEVIFENSKVIGINWADAKWPLVKLCSPIKFYNSNISHSSFFELELAEMVIEECKSHNVDYRGADLSNGSFILTDFENSLFMHTNLSSADLTDAYNYPINPNENNIKNAKFSFPEVLALLNYFNIEIVGI